MPYVRNMVEFTFWGQEHGHIDVSIFQSIGDEQGETAPLALTHFDLPYIKGEWNIYTIMRIAEALKERATGCRCGPDCPAKIAPTAPRPAIYKDKLV